MLMNEIRTDEYGMLRFHAHDAEHDVPTLENYEPGYKPGY